MKKRAKVLQVLLAGALLLLVCGVAEAAMVPKGPAIRQAVAPPQVIQQQVPAAQVKPPAAAQQPVQVVQPSQAAPPAQAAKPSAPASEVQAAPAMRPPAAAAPAGGFKPLVLIKIEPGASPTAPAVKVETGRMKVSALAARAAGAIGMAPGMAPGTATDEPTISTGPETATDEAGWAISGDWSDKITAGYAHACALDKDGKAFCWGLNSFGQLGTKACLPPYSSSCQNVDKPTKIWGNNLFSDISAGYYHTCGVATDGALYCWGRNNKGQLGLGDQISRSFPWYPVITYPNIRKWLAVAAGDDFTCAIRDMSEGASPRPTSGPAYCWGHNDHGQVGNLSTTDTVWPVAVTDNVSFTSITSLGDHVCGISGGNKKPDGTPNYQLDNKAFCWGNNRAGQIDGDATKQGDWIGPARLTDRPWRSIFAGSNFTCGIRVLHASDPAGELWCFGSNSNEKVGTYATLVEGINGMKWVSTAAGGETMCAINEVGDLFCTGDSIQAREGLGKLTEVQIAGGGKWTKVAVGDMAHTYADQPVGFQCAVNVAGALFCWGGNRVGQLGTGVRDEGGKLVDSPVPVYIPHP